MSHEIGAMTMLGFAEAMARKAWLVLPIGTSEEQGPHLPQRLFPSGVMGDASKASRALGERALRHVIGEIVRILLETASPAPVKEGRR